MGRFLQLVMGPAGVGKSTYCKTIQDHGKATRRTIHVANLDPAAEFFDYDPSFDIKDLVNIDTVMEEHGYGPNGGLVYCMEYLLQNSEWLKDELDNFGEDEYVILDCPGDILVEKYISKKWEQLNCCQTHFCPQVKWSCILTYRSCTICQRCCKCGDFGSSVSIF